MCTCKRASHTGKCVSTSKQCKGTLTCKGFFLRVDKYESHNFHHFGTEQSIVSILQVDTHPFLAKGFVISYTSMSYRILILTAGLSTFECFSNMWGEDTWYETVCNVHTFSLTSNLWVTDLTRQALDVPLYSLPISKMWLSKAFA